MAQILLQPGNYIAPYLGVTPLTIADQTWFTAANVNIYKPSTSRAGYVKNAGGSNQNFAPFKQFVPAATVGELVGYIFEVKTAFTLDSTLFAPVPKPVISSLSSASRSPGELLNITGSGFANTRYVLVGLTAAQINFASLTSTQVTVTVPATATAATNVPVVVITNAGVSNILTALTITTTPTTTPTEPTTYTNGYSASSYSSAYSRS